MAEIIDTSIKTSFDSFSSDDLLLYPEWVEIYHITQLSTFEKIVKESIIWFSELNSMNDEKEVMDFFDVIIPESRDYKIDGMGFDEVMKEYRSKVFSLSTSIEQITNRKIWDEYTRDQIGVCFEMDTRSLILSLLKKNLEPLTGSCFYYGEIIYTDEEKKNSIGNGFDDFINRILADHGLPPKPINKSPIFVINEYEQKNVEQSFDLIPHYSKGLKWKEEKEFRLSFFPVKDTRLIISNPKPHIEMHFDPMCITRVFIDEKATEDEISRLISLVESYLPNCSVLLGAAGNCQNGLFN